MRSRIVRGALPFLVAAAVVSTMVAALAVRTTMDDPNDTAGVLDVRRARYEWVPGISPRWTVLTFSTWSEAFVWDRGYLFVELDTRGDPGADYYTLLYSDGRRMRGTLFRVGALRDARVADVAVRRTNHSSIEVAIPWGRMRFGPSRETFTWWVSTSLSGEVCPRPCMDRAPDEGGSEEWRPGYSPTPTPTPTPTPSPTSTSTSEPPPVAA